jgi:hypothetical protein
VPSLDQHWHPFSIASCPSAGELEFYVEVFGPHTWTGKLWHLLDGNGKGGLSQKDITIKVMGPYGTSLGNTKNCSHGMAIGAGTGIDPVLSMFKQHVRELPRLSPCVHFQILDETRKRRVEYKLAAEERKGSLAGQVVGGCGRGANQGKVMATKADRLRQNIRQSVTQYYLMDKDGRPGPSRQSAKELQKAAYKATKSLYGVFMGVLTTLGVTLVGLTISWNTMNSLGNKTKIEIYEGMITILKIFTVVFQVCFAFTAAFIWDRNSLYAFLDMAVCLIAGPSDYYWFNIYDEHGSLQAVDITAFCLLTGYTVARLWTKAVSPRHLSLQHSQKAQPFLVEELSKTKLYQQGFVHFGRPNFGELIENHTIGLIDRGSRSSNTLFAFCGSPVRAQELHRCKVSNNMVTAITSNIKWNSLARVMVVFDHLKRDVARTTSEKMLMVALAVTPQATRLPVIYLYPLPWTAMSLNSLATNTQMFNLFSPFHNLIPPNQVKTYSNSIQKTLLLVERKCLQRMCVGPRP